MDEMGAVYLHPARIPELPNVQGYRQLQETRIEVAKMQEVRTEERFFHFHKGEIKSNGGIVVRREGVISRDLYALKQIRFEHDASVCCGSTLDAGESINAKVLVGKTESNTAMMAKVFVQNGTQAATALGATVSKLITPSAREPSIFAI